MSSGNIESGRSISHLPLAHQYVCMLSKLQNAKKEYNEEYKMDYVYYNFPMRYYHEKALDYMRYYAHDAYQYDLQLEPHSIAWEEAIRKHAQLRQSLGLERLFHYLVQTKAEFAAMIDTAAYEREYLQKAPELPKAAPPRSSSLDAPNVRTSSDDNVRPKPIATYDASIYIIEDPKKARPVASNKPRSNSATDVQSDILNGSIIDFHPLQYPTYRRSRIATPATLRQHQSVISSSSLSESLDADTILDVLQPRNRPAAPDASFTSEVERNICEKEAEILQRMKPSKKRSISAELAKATAQKPALASSVIIDLDTPPGSPAKLAAQPEASPRKVRKLNLVLSDDSDDDALNPPTKHANQISATNADADIHISSSEELSENK